MFGSFPPSPLVGLRLQSLLEPGSRHCLWNHYTQNACRGDFECNALITTVSRQGSMLNGRLWHMPIQTPLNARFVLERNEFSKASSLMSRKLSPRIKWAGYAQIGLLFALMLTAIAYRPEGKT